MRKSLTKSELLTALRRIRDELSKATLDNCEIQAWNAFNIAADAVYLSTGECPATAPQRSIREG